MRSRIALLVATALCAKPAAFAPAMAQQAGKVSQMPFASTPLAGTELVYLVQNGISVKCTVTQCGLLGTGLTITDGAHAVSNVNHILFAGGPVVSGVSPNGVVTVNLTSPLTLTDGTHTVTGVTRETLSGAIVGGSTPNATVQTTLNVNSTPVIGGVPGMLLYDNFGVLGETPPGIAVSDGTTTISGATSLTFLSGFTVSGSSPAANATPNWAATTDIWASVAHKFIDPAGANLAIAPTTYAETAGVFSISFASGINAEITLNHADCPCTVANPAGVYAGLSGNMTITQSATGSDLINTWDSTWKFSGGTKPVLSTAANAVDVLPFYCRTTTFCAVTFVGNLQ